VARYDKDGTLDKTFAKTGTVVTGLIDEDFDYSEAKAVALQPDGKIVVVGLANNPEMYHETFAVLRLNKDGTLDKSFDKDGRVLTAIYKDTGYGPSDEANAVAIQPDGKIVVAGVTGGYPTDFALVRYLPNGKLDTKFGSGGKVVTDIGADDTASAVVIQPDGKIVAAGRGEARGGDNDFALARYNPDGKLDTKFGKGGKVTTDFIGGKDWANALVLRPDGKLVASGIAELPCGYNCRRWGFGIAQYNKDGGLDSGFGDKGLVRYDLYSSSGAYAMARRDDGKLVLAGHIGNEDFGVAMFNADGTPDKSFADGNAIRTDFAGGMDRAWAVAIRPDGKVVVAGQASVDKEDILNGDMALAQYFPGNYTPRSSR
jgi:uncharacterized delta-60 repeat protein